MTRVSANTTLFWKIFVPVFYTTIFGLLALVIVFDLGANFSIFSNLYVKISYLLMFLSLIGFMYFTIIQLKRVEFDKDRFIATNYFKTYQYAFDDIKAYKTYDFIIFKLHSIHLKAKGKFGSKIRFIPYLVGLDKIKENHSHWRILIDSDKSTTDKTK